MGVLLEKIHPLEWRIYGGFIRKAPSIRMEILLEKIMYVGQCRHSVFNHLLTVFFFFRTDIHWRPVKTASVGVF